MPNQYDKKICITTLRDNFVTDIFHDKYTHT